MSNKRNGSEARKLTRALRLSRRAMLGAAAAMTGLAIARKGPFISNAEAATPNLRLLMWQPYAIKETIASFEEKYKATFSPTFFDGNSEAFNKMKVGGTKDFDIVQGDGFWPRLYFRQGLTQALDYGKIGNMSGVFPDFLPPNFPLLADPDHAVAEKYGAWQKKSLYGRTYMGVARMTYLIGPDGKVARRWDGVKVDGHAAVVLAAVAEL